MIYNLLNNIIINLINSEEYPHKYPQTPLQHINYTGVHNVWLTCGEPISDLALRFLMFATAHKNLIKLDLDHFATIILSMQKVINSEAISSALTKHGLTQKQLAQSVGVSSQAITNWIQGKDFPRPATLLKLATTLRLNFEQLVNSTGNSEPIVAYRKKGGSKTTDLHIANAKGIGMLLKPLVPYLPELKVLRTLVTSPSTEYDKLQTVAAQTRIQIGIGETAVLGYEQLIKEFKKCGAVLVPVLWGKKQYHGNALHIRLPEEDVTFIFLNLDTRLEDFKFWMAHELAHVYTPILAGTEDGEDFADAFAGALLFPRLCAELAYNEAICATTTDEIISILQSHATTYQISLFTVFQQIKFYAQARGFCELNISDKIIHATRNSEKGVLVSMALFDPLPPEPKRYIAACEQIFQSDFFAALKRIVQESGTGPSYLQQILDTSIRDAHALYQELHH